MKKNVLMLVFLALVGIGAARLQADSASKLLVPKGVVTDNDYYVVPVTECPSSGFKTVATPTMSIPGDTAVKVYNLPEGTKRFRLWVHPGKSVNFGPSDVASGTAYPSVASATLSDYFNISRQDPEIYFIGTDGAATGTLICE